MGGGIAGKSGTTVTFDVTTGQRVLSAAKEFDSILCCDIRPGFDIVATGSPSRRIKLWHTESQEQLQSIKKHTDWVTALDISPDGILLATGDRNGGVYVWEADSGGDFHTLRAHQAAITRALFRPDSNVLGTASEDGTIRMWEMNGGTEVKKIDAHGGGVRGFDWARDGSFVSAGRDRKVKYWKSSFSLERELGSVPALPTTIAYESTANRAFVGDVNGQVHVIDVAKGKIVAVIENNPPTVASRIERIDLRLHELEQSIASAREQATIAEQKWQQHQQSITQAEAARQQSKQQAVAAERKVAERKKQMDAKQQQLAAKQKSWEVIHQEHRSAKQAREESQKNLSVAQSKGEGPAIEQCQRLHAEADAICQQKQAALTALEAELHPLRDQCKTLEADIKNAEQAHALALSKVKLNESAAAKLKQASAALETQHKETIAQLKSLQEEPTALQHSRQRWVAASINTQALRAREEATTQQQEFEDLVATFLQEAKEIEMLASARQKEFAALTRLMKQVPAAEADDHQAWQKKVHAQKKKSDAAHRQLLEAEKALLSLRAEIEQKTPNRVSAVQQSQQLRDEYLRLLAQKTD